MAWVRVRIDGVGEWSQLAGQPLREDVGEYVVEGSEHDTPYRDHPEPPDALRPLPGDAVEAAATDPAPDGVRVTDSSKGA